MKTLLMLNGIIRLWIFEVTLGNSSLTHVSQWFVMSQVSPQAECKRLFTTVDVFHRDEPLHNCWWRPFYRNEPLHHYWWCVSRRWNLTERHKFSMVVLNQEKWNIANRSRTFLARKHTWALKAETFAYLCPLRYCPPRRCLRVAGVDDVAWKGRKLTRTTPPPGMNWHCPA